MNTNLAPPSIPSDALNCLHYAASWADKMPDWLVAVGTIGAVVVALWQTRAQRTEATSRSYYEQATAALRKAVEDFSAKVTPESRPLNDRRHWLNFARGIGTAQELATKIQTQDLREIWARTEHYWRERVYDMLDPTWESFPVDYYGYSAPADRMKNFANKPGERASLSEPSLVFVYRWIQWPEGYTDSLDKEIKFTDAEIEKMVTFGPRGLAEYIRIRRDSQANNGNAQPP